MIRLFPKGLGWFRLVVPTVIVLIGVIIAMPFLMTRPEKSGDFALPPPTPELSALISKLKKHVFVLAGEIGERNFQVPKSLLLARDYIHNQMQAMGYRPEFDSFSVKEQQFNNVITAIKGSSSDEVVVIGAHFDTALGCPGADDNASGVAALIELLRMQKNVPPKRTLIFAAFTNEEPPFYFTKNMGSRVFAKKLRQQKSKVVAMISLESIGYYTNVPGSQQYPFPLSYFYPDRGNFIALVSNLSSRKLLGKAIDQFRKSTSIPLAGIAAPWFFPGIGWSDQLSFWQEGFPGIMITDTVPYRNPHYHLPNDRPDSLNYSYMAYVVGGIHQVINHLVNE